MHDRGDPGDGRKGWYGNPVTGPVYVKGAIPGDTLAVHIHEMTVDTLGWIPVWPHLFHFEDLIEVAGNDSV